MCVGMIILTAFSPNNVLYVMKYCFHTCHYCTCGFVVFKSAKLLGPLEPRGPWTLSSPVNRVWRHWKVLSWSVVHLSITTSTCSDWIINKQPCPGRVHYVSTQGRAASAAHRDDVSLCKTTGTMLCQSLPLSLLPRSTLINLVDKNSSSE